MPVGQREYDLMQMQAQLHIMKMVEEWRRQFLGGRLSQSQQETQPSTGVIPGGVPYGK